MIKKLNHDFFRSRCLHICLHVNGITNYEMSFSESDEHMLKCLISKLTEEKALNKLHDAEIMLEIEKLWQKEKDDSYTDEWFIDKYKEFLQALYTQPTDKVTDIFQHVDFKGRKLCYRDNTLTLLDANPHYLPDIGVFPQATVSAQELSFPFAPQSLWEAMLLLMSNQWMWYQVMHIVVPCEDDKNKMLPRVTMYGDKALATFYSATEEITPGNRSIYKNGVLVQRKDDSFEIIGGYQVYKRSGYNFIGLTDDPETIPPPVSEEVLIPLQEKEKTSREAFEAMIAEQKANGTFRPEDWDISF